MARGRRGFKFSSAGGKSARRTANSRRGHFRNISRSSSGGRTKSTTPGFK